MPCGLLALCLRLDVPVGVQLVHGCRSSRRFGHRTAEPPPHLQAVPSSPWLPSSRQSTEAAQPPGDRRARTRAQNLLCDRLPLFRAARSPPSMPRSSAASKALLPARSRGGRGVCRISARSTLTRALPSSESERGNLSRLESERAAFGEIFRRAPRAAYVSISTDIGYSPSGGNRLMMTEREPPATWRRRTGDASPKASDFKRFRRITVPQGMSLLLPAII